MDKSYNVINEFLNNPQNTDSLYESDTVIAIDWREDDEDIVQYFNHAIGYKISVQMGNNDKHYGKDIILTYKEKTVKIPYEEVCVKYSLANFLTFFFYHCFFIFLYHKQAQVMH